jgi:hypothetical protein
MYLSATSTSEQPISNISLIGDEDEEVVVVSTVRPDLRTRLWISISSPK